MTNKQQNCPSGKQILQKHVMKNLKTNKEKGYDLILPRLVRESADVLFHPLS